MLVHKYRLSSIFPTSFLCLFILSRQGQSHQSVEKHCSHLVPCKRNKFTHISDDGVKFIFVEVGLGDIGVLLVAQRVLKHRGKLDGQKKRSRWHHTNTHSLCLSLFIHAHTPAETWIQPVPLQSSPTAWSRTSKWIAL